MLTKVRKHRLLYVEDDRETAKFCKAVLSDFDYKVDVTYSGENAKKKFKRNAYDAILLDYRLPDTDGLELARALLAKNPIIPIIFIIGRGNEKVAAEALALGASYYIVKDNPEVYTTVLPEVLKNVIERAEAAKQSKIIQENLARSDERYMRALVGSNDGLWEWNIRTGVEYFSPRWKEILGYEDNELENERQVFLNSIHPDDIDRYEQYVKKHLEGRSPYDIKLRLRHRQGHYVPVRSRAKTFWDENGDPIYLSGALTDITEAIEAEEALRQSEAQFRTSFDDARIGMIISDGIGQIIKPNKAFCRMLGYSEAEIIERQISNLMHPDDHVDSVKVFRKFLDDEIPSYHLEGRFIHKDGRTIWASFNVASVRDADGKILNVITQIEDVTEQKLAQEALHQSEQRFKGFAESTADRFWETDEDFRYTYVSKAQPDAGRISSDEVIGKTRWETPGIDIDNEIWKKHRADLEAHLPIRNFEYRRTLPDGSDSWMRTTGKPIFHSDGTFKGYRGTATDVTAEINSRKEIESVRQRFNDAIDSISDAVILYDAEDRIVTCNSQARIDLAEIEDCLRPGTHLIDVLNELKNHILMPTDEKESDWVKQAIKKFKDKRRDIQQFKDGRWVHVTRHKTADGGTLVYHSDITEQKAVEEALRDQGRRMGVALNTAKMGTWEWNIVDDTHIWDDHNKKLFGIDPDKFKGTMPEDFLNLIHEDDGEVVHTAITNALEGKEEYDVDYRVRWSDGGVYWLNARADVVRNDDGTPLKMIGACMDITERKIHEQGLQDALNERDILRRRLIDAIDSFTGGFVLYDKEDRLVIFNDNYFKAMNDVADILVPGTPFETFLRTRAERNQRKDGITRDEKWIQKRLEQHRNPRSVMERTYDDGTVFQLHEFKTREGGTVLIRTDVTELTYSQRELMSAKIEAETANQAKSDFLSSMSHELRTPLNAILGFGQLLANNPTEPLSEAQLDHVHQILKGGDHLLDLIDQVLELAKIEAGKVDFKIETVDTAKTIKYCLKMVGTQATAANINLISHVDGQSIPGVRADGQRFRQVLLNLLSNAIKYNRKNGTVIVTTHATDEAKLRISVQDNGYGIPKHRQKGLFEPFNRLGREAGDIEGTGIGLTITKQIVELMDGQIGFESKARVGSTFWIELPIAKLVKKSKRKSVKKKAAAQTEFKLNGIRQILYVENNQQNLRLMESIIQRVPNLVMLLATNAEQGIYLAKEKQPDLILMDIDLPFMDGVEALKILRRSKKTSHIPVIALTAAAMPQDIERGMNAGFKKYITKPINVPELLGSINEILK